MAVTASHGNRKVKVNCCNALLKQCLELIDAQASAVLASEDIEDLDISAMNMVVCRETLNISKESEVFNALQRWSTRECKRQRLELTPENRRSVLEGSQYLVRYLVMSQDEFTKGPFRSGILTKEEEESILVSTSLLNSDHVLSSQSSAHPYARVKEIESHLVSRQLSNLGSDLLQIILAFRRSAVTYPILVTGP